MREDIAKGTEWKMECIGRLPWKMVKSAIVRATREGKGSHAGKRKRRNLALFQICLTPDQNENKRHGKGRSEAKGYRNSLIGIGWRSKGKIREK
jgi:hypothetical protein